MAGEKVGAGEARNMRDSRVVSGTPGSTGEGYSLRPSTVVSATSLGGEPIRPIDPSPALKNALEEPRGALQSGIIITTVTESDDPSARTDPTSVIVLPNRELEELTWEIPKQANGQQPGDQEREAERGKFASGSPLKRPQDLDAVPTDFQRQKEVLALEAENPGRTVVLLKGSGVHTTSDGDRITDRMTVHTPHDGSVDDTKLLYFLNVTADSLPLERSLIASAAESERLAGKYDGIVIPTAQKNDSGETIHRIGFFGEATLEIVDTQPDEKALSEAEINPKNESRHKRNSELARQMSVREIAMKLKIAVHGAIEDAQIVDSTLVFIPQQQQDLTCKGDEKFGKGIENIAPASYSDVTKLLESLELNDKVHLEVGNEEEVMAKLKSTLKPTEESNNRQLTSAQLKDRREVKGFTWMGEVMTLEEAQTLDSKLSHVLAESEKARDTLIAENIGLVKSKRRKFPDRYREVAVDAGMERLIRLAHEWDPARGYSFPAIAEMSINGSMHNAYRDTLIADGMPRKVYELWDPVLRAQSSLEVDGLPDTAEAIAQILAKDSVTFSGNPVNPETITEVLHYVNNPSGLVYLDTPVRDGDGNTVGDILLVGSDFSARIDDSLNFERVTAAVRDPSAREFLRRRYLEGKTHEAIAKEMGASSMTASRLNEGVVHELRDIFDREAFEQKSKMMKDLIESLQNQAKEEFSATQPEDNRHNRSSRSLDIIFDRLLSTIIPNPSHREIFMMRYDLGMTPDVITKELTIKYATAMQNLITAEKQALHYLNPDQFPLHEKPTRNHGNREEREARRALSADLVQIINTEVDSDTDAIRQRFSQIIPNEKQLVVFLAFHREGFEQPQIAEKLGITKYTVSYHLANAEAAVQEYLEATTGKTINELSKELQTAKTASESVAMEIVGDLSSEMQVFTGEFPQEPDKALMDQARIHFVNLLKTFNIPTSRIEYAMGKDKNAVSLFLSEQRPVDLNWLILATEEFIHVDAARKDPDMQALCHIRSQVEEPLWMITFSDPNVSTGESLELLRASQLSNIKDYAEKAQIGVRYGLYELDRKSPDTSNLNKIIEASPLDPQGKPAQLLRQKNNGTIPWSVTRLQTCNIGELYDYALISLGVTTRTVIEELSYSKSKINLFRNGEPTIDNDNIPLVFEMRGIKADSALGQVIQLRISDPEAKVPEEMLRKVLAEGQIVFQEHLPQETSHQLTESEQKIYDAVEKETTMDGKLLALNTALNIDYNEEGSSNPEIHTIARRIKYFTGWGVHNLVTRMFLRESRKNRYRPST